MVMSSKAADPDRHPLIVGGGHSGLLLALALDRHGIEPVVVDADPVDQVLKAPFDGRALALMQGSKRVFDALGLWPEIEPIATPIWSVRVQDEGTGGTIAYDARDVGNGAFGYGIENRLLRRRLLELVLARPTIHFIAPARLESLTRDARRIAARLVDGRTIETALVIGADGRRSSVRRLAGIRTRRLAYRQTAITLAFRHQRPHEHRVREYMSTAGPLALLPIGERLCSATWIERPDRAEKLLAGNRQALQDALTARHHDELEVIDILGMPCAFPLAAEVAERYAAPRVALVGDAAHGLHPIHAQGWNLGVRDIAGLAEALVDAARCGQALGAAETLQRYARERNGDASLILGLTDGLNRLFSTDLPPAKLLRHAALTALDNLPPVKNWAMRRGMGLSGNLPKLARGERLA
jgi:2-octaprenyl-6-methoxyphenol hydroxylase